MRDGEQRLGVGETVGVLAHGDARLRQQRLVGGLQRAGYLEDSVSREWLLGQLEEVWEERLADAEAVQGLLQGGAGAPEGEGPSLTLPALGS